MTDYRTLAVFAGPDASTDLIGRLHYLPGGAIVDFTYADSWIGGRRRYSLSPRLSPERLAGLSAAAKARELHAMLANLLPEGRRLTSLARLLKRHPTDTAGLLADTASETAGMLRFVAKTRDSRRTAFPADVARELTVAELGQRIAWRDSHPFVQWDERIPGSLSGSRDKLGVWVADGRWHVLEGERGASTHIAKVGASTGGCSSLAANEHVCLRLAAAVGLPVVRSELYRTTSGPVLLTERFDRQTRLGSKLVRRLHVVDGCQLLGLTPAQAIEQPYADGRGVVDLRPGATLSELFAALREHATEPRRETLRLLRWVLLQVLLGAGSTLNAKNVTFVVEPGDRLRLAPAYALRGELAFAHAGWQGFGMRVGGAWFADVMEREHWQALAAEADIDSATLTAELRRLARRLESVASAVGFAARNAGADPQVVVALVQTVQRQCERVLQSTQSEAWEAGVA